MKKLETNGFAYCCLKEGIDIRTITATEIGAMVNILFLAFSFRATPSHTNEEIRSSFEREATGKGMIIPVQITGEIDEKL